MKVKIIKKEAVNRWITMLFSRKLLFMDFFFCLFN